MLLMMTMMRCAMYAEASALPPLPTSTVIAPDGSLSQRYQLYQRSVSMRCCCWFRRIRMCVAQRTHSQTYTHNTITTFCSLSLLKPLPQSLF
uniref:Putative secreted peptide n=1 Tax=Anopheles braziliensis TaxID=58242 RepID=A0A2M3ZU35_9DIPT